MALIHRAELSPTKLELLAGWLPTRAWYRGPAAPDVRRETSYRFDDPAGEVGIEALIVRVDDGPLLQVPLTYRPTPLAGHEQWLLGTAQHSVLGRRWVYDACGDAVYARALADTILTGGRQADEFVDVDGRLEPREPGAVVRGTGAGDRPDVTAVVRVEDAEPTLIVTDSVELAVVRVLDRIDEEPLRLTGTWSGQSTPVLLAYARE